MTDIADSTATEAAPVEAAPAVESAPVESTPTAEADYDDLMDPGIDLPEGMRSFDRSYVEKMREKEIRLRNRMKEAEQRAADQAARLEKFKAFEDYPDEDLEVWGGLATDWKADPTVAAARFQEIALRVLGDPTSTAAERADAQAIIDNPDIAAAVEGLTPEQVREIAREETAAQEEARKQREAVDNVFTTIKAAGYEERTVQATGILWYANNETAGDIEQAVEKYREYEQSIVDAYVERMANGGTPVRLPVTGEAATPSQDSPKTIKEAKQMADAWLRERRQQ